MTTNVASTFTWLAYSEREQQRTRDLVSMLSERDTRDELGIGSIRDAIADRLFPGTTTIQTRARYFLFIPWLFQEFEAQSKGGSRDRAEKAERALIETLRSSGDTLGLIGGQSMHVQTLPSAVYWAGLATLGIRRVKEPLSVYYRWLDEPHRHRRVVRDDDDDLLEDAATTWWDAVPPAPDDFPATASFVLTAREARYLADRAASASPSASMLAWLYRFGDATADADFPWEHPQVGAMPSTVRDDLNVAENFSRLFHGAALLFNLLIARARGEEERIEYYDARVAEWHEASTDAITAFELERVWDLAPRTPPAARSFVGSWKTLAERCDGNLADHAPAIELITQREHRIKGARSRIAFPTRVAWGGSSGAARLDFRWSVAVKQMTIDVARGRAGA